MGVGSSRITQRHTEFLWWVGKLCKLFTQVVTVTKSKINSTHKMLPKTTVLSASVIKNSVYSSRTASEDCATNTEVHMDRSEHKGKINTFILTHRSKMIGVWVCVEKDFHTRVIRVQVYNRRWHELGTGAAGSALLWFVLPLGIFWLALHLHVLNTNTCLQT